MLVKDGLWLFVCVQIGCHGKAKKTFLTKMLDGLKERSRSSKPPKKIRVSSLLLYASLGSLRLDCFKKLSEQGQSQLETYIV